MSDLVPLERLVADLQAAISGRRSGAFFVTTEDQHSAVITLSGGTITGLKYRQARGYDAASALARMTQLRYQSAAEPTALPGEGDLNTRAVLDILRSGDDPELRAAAVASAEATLDLGALREQYVSAIGPIGGALFDEAVDDLGAELGAPDGARKLIEELAAHIDDEAEARNFRRTAGS